MKASWILAAIFAALPSAAWAQSLTLSSDTPPALSEESTLKDLGLPTTLATAELLQDRIGHMRISLAIIGRLSIPGDGNVSDAGLVYSDLWSVGVGASLEGDLMTGVGGGLELGGYASIGYDSFGGRSQTDDFGNKVDPDNLRLTTAFVGGKARGHVTPWFYWEGRIGLGVVHYYATDAVITDAGFPPDTLQLFRATTHGAFEIGGMGAWGSPRFQGEFGFGYRFFGAPQRGKNISDLVNTDPFDTFTIEAGFRVRF